VLESIAVLETSAASERIAPHELSLAAYFMKMCMVTAFPDTRQKMMKTVTAFMIRVRTVFAKDIKRYDPLLAATDKAKHDALWRPLEPLYGFLDDVTRYAEENLYLDKPIEAAFPLFDVLKLVMDLFGGVEFKLNKAKSFEPVNFLAKAKGGHLLSSSSLFKFFVDSLKSSWTNVRLQAFALLSKYADEYPDFHDAGFVNGTLIAQALEYLNDPRAMMAEAAAQMLKLVFLKCIGVADLSLLAADFDGATQFDTPNDKRLAMLRLVLAEVKTRLLTFRTSLIAEGKTTALMHALLSFFKHVLADFSPGDKQQLGEARFTQWRAFFKDMLQTSLEISKVCANLLSNNRINDQGQEAVDCRGHPIAQSQDLT